MCTIHSALTLVWPDLLSKYSHSIDTHLTSMNWFNCTANCELYAVNLQRSPELRRRPRSPPEPPVSTSYNRSACSNERPQKRILPRSKRPPSPPAVSISNRWPSYIHHISHGEQLKSNLNQNSLNFLKGNRSPSNSSVSCTDDSCSVCSPKSRRLGSRYGSIHPFCWYHPSAFHVARIQ